MSLPKTILISGIIAVLVIFGSYLALKNLPNKDTLGQSLLKDYQELLKEISNSKTKDSLSTSCKQPQKFAEDIQSLKNKLDSLNERKNYLINEASKKNNELNNEDEWIPPVPGSEPLELEPMTEENLTIPELEKIDNLEKEIILKLNDLKTLCDKEKEIISTSCPDACNKYSDCAGYADDATKQDLQEAYESCIVECTNWADETKICINKKPIKAPIDCANLSICALAEYNNVLNN